MNENFIKLKIISPEVVVCSRPKKWYKPIEGKFKCNIDEVFVKAIKGCLWRPPDFLIIEVLSCREVLSWLHEENLSNVDLELDNL